MTLIHRTFRFPILVNEIIISNQIDEYGRCLPFGVVYSIGLLGFIKSHNLLGVMVAEKKHLIKLK